MNAIFIIAWTCLVQAWTLIGLKLMGQIDWPWQAVTAPLWGPFFVAGAVITGAVLIAMLFDGIDRLIARLRK